MVMTAEANDYLETILLIYKSPSINFRLDSVKYFGDQQRLIVEHGIDLNNLQDSLDFTKCIFIIASEVN